MKNQARAKTPPTRGVRWRSIGALAFVVLAAVLVLPESAPPPPAGAGQPLFEWRQDALWTELEGLMVEARNLNRAAVAGRIDAAITDLNDQLVRLSTRPLGPDNPAFLQIEMGLFRLAPLIAAHPDRLQDFVELVGRTRRHVKEQSRVWDHDALATRQTLYRLLSGTRLALETILLQLPPAVEFPQLVRSDDEPSVTPATSVFGLRVHSGDILVSRGGAPTSSLIARGNDYPGAFSHVTLVHVEPESGRVSIIESLIERGVVVSTLDEYLHSKKLRLMVLRPRSDLPAVAEDPMRPHRAATAALEEVRRRHIPYDFAMDHHDHRTQFCSEVASAAYESVGIRLWMGVSFLSSPTVTAWLASIGVRHFETQEPADLEYDAQLRVVAEWRERATLFAAHIDDAVTDVMIEQAEPRLPLPYAKAKLPLARVAKGYSAVLNFLGREGPVPEGLSATAALRVERYREDHRAIAERVLVLAEAFKREHSYAPPYWQLVRLAREAHRKHRETN